ncbi:nicotinate-nucleotide adenylyltransferase [Parvularcula oceani]|uniref:nicotinate-nucleotide adenylyltransferase n=1 Tax=Parvularcula oceani TaxID=1247963 RepID=UPI00056B6EE0|nr:nicotinate-nucleotide adenylyltransferase [Parvularcula oceani]
MRRHERAIPSFRPGQRVGLFGGSFNPAHGGHLAVAEAARAACRLDRVVWLVSPGNPLKSAKEYLGYGERLARAKALTKGRPWIEVSAAEARLGTRYTADTLTALKKRGPNANFVWIMGADSLAGFSRWRDWRLIAQMMPILVVSRPGATMKALKGRAGLRLSRFRLPPALAPTLPKRRPPAWIFLPAVHDPASATAIRAELFTLPK